VAGAVVASTLTTLVVFIPILLIEESAGQLFRDIAWAIMAAVGISMIVALSVIPSAASRLLKLQQRPSPSGGPAESRSRQTAGRLQRAIPYLFGVVQRATDLPDIVGGLVMRIIEGWVKRIAMITIMMLITVIGTWWLLPPLDYLPKGNRNVVFGMLIPPPGYNVEQLSAIGARMEARVRPAWEAAGDRFQIEPIKRGHAAVSEDRVLHCLSVTALG
jgi:HAE1 family hydrophobic/amphiphilic exporter-1